MEKIKRSVGTHSGSFHADEIVACALLALFDLIDRDKIVRTREQSKLDLCEYVCDVGGVCDSESKRFDHHLAGYQGHLSSAGMVWQYLKEQEVVDQDLYDFFNRSLVQGVDAHDIGKSPQIEGLCTFSNVISNFLPPQYDPLPEQQDRAFFAAFDFTLAHLKRLLTRFSHIKAAKEKVKEAMERGREFIFLDEAVPWQENFFALGGKGHPALFLVMPSSGHWKLRALPPSLENRMGVRFPLPQEWAGLLNDALKKVTGIEGAIFCHKGRFTSVWETKEDALKALEYVLKQVKG